MFVVRRPFRNNGQMVAPGSVVEPGTIKRFKSRLNDGHIVEVSEQDFNKWDEYFKIRIGVPIQLPKATETPEAPEASEAPEAPEAPEPLKVAHAKVTTAKGVVKTASK